jgi:hypothetical protein
MYEEAEEYSIGYGKPPRHTQFRRGKSGNPKGRPRGFKSLSTIFSKIINEKVQVKGPCGMKRITKFEAGLTQLVNMAATGDKRAIREVVQIRKSFGDLEPPLHPPVFNIRFVEAENGHIKGENSEKKEDDE